MAKKHQKTFSLYDELKPILDEYTETLQSVKEDALDKASDYLIDCLEAASPVGKTQTLKRSWMKKTKYRGVRYIGNTAVSSTPNKYGQGIPLTNLLEYSYKGNPFIRKTFESNKEKIVSIIKENIENGNTK